MATFTTCVRTNVQRTDGFYPVFARVTHNRSSLYIKTGKMVTKCDLSKSKDITYPVVKQFCAYIYK